MQFDKVCTINMLKNFPARHLTNQSRKEKKVGEKNTLLMCIIHMRLSKEIQCFSKRGQG